MTERNRLKRLARECFRRRASGLPPGDYLVYFFASAAAAGREGLRAELETAFDRLASGLRR